MKNRTGKVQKLVATWALGGLIVAALVVGAVTDVQIAQERDAQYCDMVALYKQTRGDSGWPDYRGVYDKLCTEATP